MLPRARTSVLALWIALVGCTHLRSSHYAAASEVASSEAAVRAARVRFNAAIMRRDTATISSLMVTSYVIVNGRSTQRHGRESAMGMWTSAIRDSTMSYVRSTRTVHVNETWGLAEELGDWTGYVTASDGPAHSSGVYAAKWHRTADGSWRLQAEVFTTLACEGGPIGCPRPDPIDSLE